VSDRIDPQAVGARYAEWLTRGPRGIAMRYLFSRRGLWVINTPYRRILAAAAIGPADRVLDLGCGIGNLLIALAERTPFLTPPVGVDVSPAIIELGLTELRREGLQDRVVLRAASWDRLPFPDAAFDVAISSHVLKHLDDAALATSLRELARVLRPGGRFLLWEFARSPLSAPLFASARLSGLPPPFKLRGEEALRRALRDAGFDPVTRVRTGPFLIPPVPRIALLARRMEA
jgi:ubiquinone/menaquinone biosynthesis C-methylase UbiE